MDWRREKQVSQPTFISYLDRMPEFPVKKEWLDASIRGNMLLPQRHKAMVVETLSTIFSRNEMNEWEYFAHSEMTPADRERLTNLMVHVHGRHGVKAATTETTPLLLDVMGTEMNPKSVRVVTPEEVQSLWNIVRNKANQFIIDFILRSSLMNEQEDTLRDLRDKARNPRIALAHQFLTQEEFHEPRMRFQKIISCFSEAFHSSDAQEILREYQKNLGISAKTGEVFPVFEERFLPIEQKKFKNVFGEEMSSTDILYYWQRLD